MKYYIGIAMLGVTTRNLGWRAMLFAVAVSVAGCHNPLAMWGAPSSPSVDEATGEAMAQSQDQPDDPSDIPSSEAADPAQQAAIPGEVDERVRSFVDRLARYGDTESIDDTTTMADRRNKALATRTEQPAIRRTANGAMDLADVPANGVEPLDADASGVGLPTILAVYIESTPQIPDGANEPPTRTANMGLVASVASKSLPVDEYAAWLEDQIAESPQDTDARWRLAFQQLAIGRDRQVDQAFIKADGPTSDFLRHAFELIAALRAASEDPVGRSTAALDSLDALRQRLKQDADLRVPVVEFCTRVSAYGVYDKLPDTRLPPFQANRLIVYLEVDNFLSQQVEDDSWKTLLTTRMEVLTADGQSLWTQEESEIEDLCHRRRNDFFLAQLINLPSNLGPGEYVFKVSVEDVQAAKIAQAVRPFTIGDVSSLTYAGPR